MIRRRTQSHPRNGEHGITMILVVLAMLSMLAIIALAIDVVTLYSARSETQHAADAGALAAAKMLVDMGVTTDPPVYRRRRRLTRPRKQLRAYLAISALPGEPSR